MSKASRKGAIGEVGVVDFFNQWFPDFDETGIGVKRIPSSGQNDIGDLAGIPYTCIECKNHTAPAVSSLLNNAEWKSGNHGKPIWFLTYKRSGYGQGRAGYWHAATTVEGFLDGVKPVLPGTEDPAFTLDDVDGYCYEYVDIIADLSAQFPKFPHPEVEWQVKIMFRPYKSKTEQFRNEEIDEVGLSVESRLIPIVITPRTGYDPNKWYCHTRVAGQARMLETVGLLEQDSSEYLLEPTP